MDKKGYLIAIDLDGTLLQGFNNYNQDCMELLKEIGKENYIVIATGRPLRSSKYYYDLLELNTPIINYNGALVHHPYNNDFQKSMITVNKDDIVSILNDNIDTIENIFCEVEDEIFLWKRQDEINSYLHLDGGVLHVGDFQDTLKSNPNGAIVFSKPNTGHILKKYIEDTYKGSLLIRFWDDENYVISEIYSPKTTKANGLKRIINYLNVPKEKTIAIGDGHNDIELFNECHLSIAMGNSHPELIKHADIVIKSVKENGVYHFIKEYLNK